MKNPERKDPVVDIRPTGSYFEIDKEGYLVNPASLDKIQTEWKPVVDAVVEAYKKQFGEKLKSVYLRGSVAKGEAIKNISDVDSLAYVDLSGCEIDGSWATEARKSILEKYPFVEDVEFIVRPIGGFERNIVLLNQAVCVYGEPFEVPKIRPGKEAMTHLPNFKARNELAEKKIKEAETLVDIKACCVWVMKDLLRAGFELTMERSGKYTRDLSKCYESLSEYYPGRAEQVKEVLFLALNPTADKEKIKEVRNNFVPWLQKEVKILLY